MENRNKKLMALVECALFVAVAFALDFVKAIELPYGGSIKFVMIPLMIIAFRRGVKWGTFSSLAYLVLAMIMGRENFIYPGDATTYPVVVYVLIVALFDYIIAYGVCGFARVFTKPFQNKVVGVAVASLIVCIIRYVCHVISGATVWGTYMPEDFQGGVLWYSLTYNATYMIPITIVCVIVLPILYKAAPKLFMAEEM